MSLVYPIAVVDILVVDIVSFDVDCSEHVSLADDVLAMLNCIFAAVVSDIVIIRSESGFFYRDNVLAFKFYNFITNGWCLFLLYSLYINIHLTK